MRLALANNDGDTAEAAMDRVMDLCPDREDIFAALRKISNNGSVGIDQISSRIRENIYYENLFLKDPSWSSPAPNHDEEARWGKIESCLKSIMGSRGDAGDSKPRILDLGCGRGWLSNLASRYGNIEGIDPVREVIRGARRLFPHLRLHHGTARTILDDPGFLPYDLVLSSEVIEHVPDSEKENFVADLSGLLKPGGHLVLTTPRGEAYDCWKRRTNFKDQPVEEWVTEAQVVRLFAKQGFRTIGSDRIYVNLRTLAYSALPETCLRDSADFLALYQVWAFQLQEKGCRQPQGSRGTGRDEAGEDARRAGGPPGSPLVSVIVPTHDRPEMLAAAIQSILDQSYPNVEIVVVNDAGMDVGEVVARFNRDGRIVLVGHDTNRGLAAARNTGIRHARGKYIAYLDDDDLYYPDHLGTLVRHLESSGDKVAYSDAARVHYRKQADGSYHVTGRDYPHSHDFDPRELLIENYIPVLCLVHEKSCLEESGHFDDSLKRHEDWDLWIRLSGKYRFAHVPKVTCEYSNRSDGSGMTTGTIPMFLESYHRIYGKYGGSAGDDPELAERRKENLHQFRKTLYNFIHEKIASLLLASKDAGPGLEQSVIGAFAGTGALKEHILSGFYYLLGWFGRNSGETDRAVANFRNALERDPEHPFALADLLALVSEKGDLEGERKVLEAILSANPRDVAAARRLADIRGRLPGEPATERSKKLRIAVFSVESPEHACVHLRLAAPLAMLKGEIETVWGVMSEDDNYRVDENACSGADLVILQRFFPNERTWPFIDRLVRSGVPVIYETDDLLTCLPASNPHKEYADGRAPFIEKTMRSCAAVTVSTRELSEETVVHNPSVHILPNLIDADLWTAPAGRGGDNGRLVIGYSGTPTHQADLEHVEEALEIIAGRYGDRVGFLFMGCATERMRRLPNVSFMEFRSSYREYVKNLCEARIDIAIAPLANSRFNRCKSNIKWLEYGACGIPGIYSDLPAYRSSVDHGRTGLLAGSCTEDWVLALDRLIRNPDERAGIARAARAEIGKKYTLAAQASLYLDAYREIVGRHSRQARAIGEGRSLPVMKEGRSRGEGKFAVSIVIPVFNKVEYTRKCIEALAATVDAGDPVEFVVVDNGSTDGTPAFLATLSGDVVLVRNTGNLGFAAACNQGARVARGESILFLNNDTVPQPGWLRALVTAAEEENAAICGARLLYPDGRVQHAGIAFDRRGVGYHIFNGLPKDDPAVSKRRPFQAVTAACMLVRRSLFEELGGFDEGYRNGFEDVDFCLRARQTGHRVLYAPESVVVHHEESTEGRKTHDRENLERFLARWKGKVEPDDERIYGEEGFEIIANADGTGSVITRAAKRPDSAVPSSPASVGRSLKKAKRFSEAVAAFEEALSGGDDSVLADIGDCLAQEGKVEEAEAAYGKAIGSEPGNPRALAGLGILHHVRGEYARAAERFASALERDGGDATSLCGMGLVRKAEGSPAEAFSWFRRSLDADPVNVAALHELVKAAHQTGHLGEAEGYLLTYLKYKPADPHILFSLAGVLFTAGKGEEALDALDRLAFFDPSYGGADELRERISARDQAV